jgi:DDE superfamily endonuclease
MKSSYKSIECQERVSFESFWRLKTIPFLGCKQAPVAHQLLVFLRYIGTEGSGGSNANQRHVFAIGYRTSEVCRRRVTQAILSLREKYLTWQREEEHQQIALEIHKLYNFPHCAALALRTERCYLLHLSHKQKMPRITPGGSIDTQFPLTMVVCDHRRRIRYYLSGYPRSAHDNRVFSRGTKLKKSPSDFFGVNQYIVGDSAFENDWFMVSAFKKQSNQVLADDHGNFNKKLAKLCIISEHCIGMFLKGRFP